MSRPIAFEVRRLRALAAWSRGSAEAADDPAQQSRIEWAKILDRLADDFERQAAANKRVR